MYISKFCSLRTLVDKNVLEVLEHNICSGNSEHYINIVFDTSTTCWNDGLSNADNNTKFESLKLRNCSYYLFENHLQKSLLWFQNLTTFSDYSNFGSQGTFESCVCDPNGLHSSYRMNPLGYIHNVWIPHYSVCGYKLQPLQVMDP